MATMRFFLCVLSILAAGCTHHISLLDPTLKTPASCGLQVTDVRPDPAALYFRSTKSTGRAVLEPPIAEIIRRSACAVLPPQRLANAAKFVVTDFECTVTGFFELRYVVDLRGRLEIPGQIPVELRSGNVQLSSNGYVPKGCEVAATPALSVLAAEIVKEMQENSAQKH